MRRLAVFAALTLAGCSLQYTKSKALEGSSGSSGGSSTGSSGSTGGPACTSAPLSSHIFGIAQYSAPSDVALQPAALGGSGAWLTAGLDANGIVSVQVMRFDGGGPTVGPSYETDGGYGGDESVAPADLYHDGSEELVLRGNVIDIFAFGPDDMPKLRQRLDTTAEGFADINNLAAIDVNQDGWLDLVGIDNGGSTILYVNDQAGSFTRATPPVDYDWGNFNVLTAEDIAGDGHRLLFLSRSDVGGNGGELAVFGDSSPEPIATYTPRVNNAALWHFTEDLDGDGLRDLVAVSPGLGFSVLYGLPDAGFGRSASVDVAAATGFDVLDSLSVGDFNRDCLPDAIVTAYRSVYLYLGLPDGGFDVHPMPDGGLSPDAMNVDVNGDVPELRGWVLDGNGDTKPDLLLNVSISDGNPHQAVFVPRN